MAREKTQADFRKMHNATDKWGREYLITREIASGDPTGPLNQNFTDPLRTPGKYLSSPGNAPYTVVTDYVQWIADLKENQREWETSFAQACEDQNVDMDEIIKRGPKTAKERAALKFAGSQPLDWTLVEKAMNGDEKYLHVPSERKKAKTPGSTNTTCGVCEAEYDGAACPECKERFRKSQQAAKMRAGKKSKVPAASAA